MVRSGHVDCAYLAISYVSVCESSVAFFLSFCVFLSFFSFFLSFFIYLLVCVLMVYCISVFLCFYVVIGGGDAAR